MKRQTKFLKGIEITFILVAIALLFIWLGTRETLPREIRIASGVEGGQYSQFAKFFAKPLGEITNRKIFVLRSEGSNHNYQLLKNGDVDLAIIQLGPTGLDDGHKVIAPLYPEVVQIIVRRDSNIDEISKLAGKSIGVNVKGSGMRDVANKILAYAGLTDDVIKKEKNLTELTVADGFLATSGLLNKKIAEFMRSGEYEILSMPDAEGIALKEPFFEYYTLPRGFYKSGIPKKPIHTIATMAVLVAKKDSPHILIEMALQALYETNLRHEIPVLLTRGEASQWSVYPIHPETRAYFNPFEGIDLLANIMDSLAGFWALILAGSMATAGIIRINKNRTIRKNKEVLDSYLNKTINVERKQIDIEDPDELKKCLDEVTAIKLEALQKLTNKEIRADHAFEDFLMQCDNLCQNIAWKLQYFRKSLQ